MGRIRGHYEWDDPNLSPGNKREGGLHQNLYDSDGHLKGSARFVPDEDDSTDPITVTQTVYIPVQERDRDDDELDEAIATVLRTLLILGAKAVQPHLEQWWRDSARPALHARMTQLRHRRPWQRKAIDPNADLTPAPAPDQRPTMSKAEAQARILAALAAKAYSDEQIRLVHSATITNDSTITDLHEALAQIPTAELTALLHTMASNPATLTEDNLAQLASQLHRHTLNS